jgi:hypothetical protein
VNWPVSATRWEPRRPVDPAFRGTGSRAPPVGSDLAGVPQNPGRGHRGLRPVPVETITLRRPEGCVSSA